ncbi:Oidioi.mRNA.OKI2018_I69.PAR.g9396.t1.cds [Oikopleura dioica]|uniref:Oidioi.mRNA.OKI2018_I69.PAR.g9396.t1.cds n=1 Tax=Oikopleura dioica TaxID=34765 RepID=A0ABN7RNR3_OIKDI|nr:Oidioi.mRNA.OKI2018_I69.PAR.g9396.t1.cds [Oikopleura dioica]
MGKFAGTWQRTKVEGAEAFFKALNAPEDKLKRAAAAELTSVVKSDGKEIELTRTYTLAGESKSATTKVTVGAESEINGPLGGTHKVTVEADGDAVVCKTTDGAMSIRFEIVGEELVETFSAKGNTFKRWHKRA